MPGWRARLGERYRRHRLGRPSALRRMSVRGLTFTAGLALGLTGLLALTLLSGLERAGEAPSVGPEGEPDRLGPLTAVQPDLRQALLTGRDLPPAPTASRSAGAAPPAATGRTAAPPPLAIPLPLPVGPPLDPEVPAAAELCRALFEDPAGQATRWSTSPPRQVTSGDTPHPDGSTLRQSLTVFEDEDAPASFGQLRDAAAGCEQFPATLHGEPVTVVLRPPPPAGREESAPVAPAPATPGPATPMPATVTPGPDPLTPDPATPAPTAGLEEAAFVPADEEYQLELMVYGERETLTGWLAFDRVGPVISVLRRLGPRECSPEETIQTRRAALTKLRALLDGPT